MTLITTLEKFLQTKAEELLEKKGYTKTFCAEGLGSMWEKNNTVVEITVYAGHRNALIIVEPYIVVRVNGDPHVIDTKKEVEELFATL